MVDLFKIPTPMSFDSLVSLLKWGSDGYKILVVSPAVATELVDRYDGHPKPSMVAEPVENTAMGNFFGTFSRGAKMVPTHPDSSRESVLISAAGILKAVGGHQVSHNKNEPLSEGLFSFIKEPIYDNKSIDQNDIDAAEKVGKRNKDTYPKNSASKAAGILLSPRAFSWRDVARAKNIQQTRNKITVGIMFLLYITASIWSAEARSYPVSGPQSANVNSFDNQKPLVICGYPCCGFNIHGPCNRCCPKGVLHAPPTTHVKEAGSGGGDGHRGGDRHN